jgi:hypothetical protein
MAKPASARAHHWLIALSALAVFVSGLLMVSGPGPAYETPARKINWIVSKLQVLEGAKDQFAQEHQKKQGDPVDWPDLAPYLKGGTISTVLNESYSLNSIGSKPTARVSIKMGTYAAGSLVTVP